MRFDRRGFLGIAGAAGAGAVLAGQGASAKSADDEGAGGAERAKAGGEPIVKRYRTLGKTGLKVSDVAFGGGSIEGGPPVVEKAIQLGVNFFDTAPDYGKSESIIGKAIKDRKLREVVTIQSKICRPVSYPGHVRPGTAAAKIVELVEGSLRRLQTDYIDILLVHALGEPGMGDVRRAKDEATHKAYETLKRDGKIRFTGASSHGPNEMASNLEYVVESGVYDVIMPAFNFMGGKKQEALLAKAAEKGVGVVAMKCLAGQRKTLLPKLHDNWAKFQQAALRYVWANEAIAGAVVTIKNIDQLKKYVANSGTNLKHADLKLLKAVELANSAVTCRVGCGDCLSSCPNEVKIADIQRYEMYFKSYGDEKRAMTLYAGLPLAQSAATCLGCSGEPCRGACTHGIDIRGAMLRSHEALDLPRVAQGEESHDHGFGDPYVTHG
ncbi:MAG: aldo/keto reductase [Deltaproteobacteria bacterium]|nr:aldo/keto reductase [Deltaproteobacteria bacterium]